MVAARVIGGSPDSGVCREYRSRLTRWHSPATWASSHQTVSRENSRRLSRHFAGLLLGDKERRLGALLADTRTQGVVRGSGKPELTMDYVSNEAKVSAGEAY